MEVIFQAAFTPGAFSNWRHNQHYRAKTSKTLQNCSSRGLHPTIEKSKERRGLCESKNLLSAEMHLTMSNWRPMCVSKLWSRERRISVHWLRQRATPVDWIREREPICRLTQRGAREILYRLEDKRERLVCGLLCREREDLKAECAIIWKRQRGWVWSGSRCVEEGDRAVSSPIKASTVYRLVEERKTCTTSR